MQIKEIAKKYEAEIIQLRRHFHMYPESSLQEFETSKKIQAELSKLNIPFKVLGETGVLATIEGKNKGKTVLLRADIDALEIEEKSTHDYVSKIAGKMHACGHDAHTAMLLGAAKVLNEAKDQINGTAKLLFQPAEEVGKGSRMMIEHGALDGVDGAFGIHIWSGLETGKVSAQAGPRMASADYFEIIVKGFGGHGSMPHQTVDPVVVGASIVMNLQPVISREMNPLEPVVVTVGQFNSGTRFNIIPETATLVGTTRCFNTEIWKDIDVKIKRVVENIGHAYRAQVTLNYEKILPPTVNNSQCSAIAENAIAKLFGNDAVSKMEKTTGGEDFAYIANKVPSCFAFVGCGNKAKGIDLPHHHERFDIDEDALAIGASVYAQYAIDFLNHKEKIEME